MRNFLAGETYYLKKDTTTKGISFLFTIASIVLVVVIGSKTGFNMDNVIEPILIITKLSLLLYFIIPIHACFFATEGFESGTVKNIIASGQSRVGYVIGKYIAQFKIILLWIVQFFGLYYILYMLGALVTSANVGGSAMQSGVIEALSVLGFNILYLTGFSTIILMVGLLVRKAASATVITFVVVFGDLMANGYLRDSTSPLLRFIGSNSLTAQVMKFSGIYVVDGERFMLSSISDYVSAIAIPICIIIISLIISVVSFKHRDIHA